MSDKALTATVSCASNGSPAEILINGAGLDGANITTVVTKSATGDGLVNIGRITATNLDLGTATTGDGFGLVAKAIGSVKITGTAYTASLMPTQLGAIFDDVTLRLL